MKHGNSSRSGSLCTTLLLLLSLVLPAATICAQESEVYVPDELKPWQDWVLHGKEYLGCPFVFDQRPPGRDAFICAWPGELEVAVAANSGRFTQSWTVYASEQWLPIPGNSELWPEQVTADGQGIVVVMRGGLPHVRLAPGRHTIAGRFAWEERPRTLPVPAETGLLQLTVDGSRVARPERNRNAVWLGEREAEARAQDSIEVEVHRVVVDDVPTRLVTTFTVEASGSMREELLGPALPGGFVPMALESELPARFEPGGELRLQVRPGSWQVVLWARSEDVREEVTLQAPSHNLPAHEIWSYQGNDRLRVTAAGGLPPVDPMQVAVPDEFRQLPAFRIEPGETLSILERSRGKAATNNQLHLERLLWLDFDGGGFTFSDAVDGTMQSGWRLDMAQPYALLSASQEGESLLVTRGAEDGLTGVELRLENVDLQAVGRSAALDALPVTGWQTRLEGVTTWLNLPPGHKLIAAAGADRAPGAWAERWQLLDFFLVLIITLAAGRLFGWQAGGIAFLALVLSWHEHGAPQWAWLNLLAAVALVRVAPAGRLRAAALAWRGISLLAVLVLLVPFFAGELRIAIYPQLEPQAGGIEELRLAAPQPEMAVIAGAGRAAQEDVRQRRAEATAPAIEEVIVTATRNLKSYARYAPNAIVQAGPGRPSWRWNSYELYWSGPVDPERLVSLMIMPRWLVTSLRFLEVLLLTGLVAVFVSEILGLSWPWPPRRHRPAGTALSILVGGVLIVAAGLASTPAARAQTPSPEVLQQLEQRLLEPPPCTPSCAELVEARVDAGREAMTIELVVHALAEVAVPLPGSLAGWRPEQARIDGAPAPHVYRSADHTLWIRVTEGRHRIAIDGPLPPVDSLEVPFPAPPRVITAEAEGWTLAGIDRRHLRSGSLQLIRLREEDAAAGGAARWESSRFPEFVRIERTIELDLDWRVRTTVTRVAPRQGAITLKVPMLAGASLLTDLPVTDGEVLVSIGASERAVEWSAALPRTSPLTLKAPESAPWKEVWRFGIGNIWHVSFSGVPESEAEDSVKDVRIAEFYPRGGESLTLTAGRPEASRGTTLAFDRVSVMSEVGARSRDVTMTLAYRSTRGAQHIVRLPADSQVTEVSIDGRNEPLRADEGELSLPILPGEHSVTVHWRRDAEIDATVRTPEVDLDAAASNITLGLDLPANRWVLATNGPRLGPAVMYWSELAAMILFALILGRTSLTPLGTRQWLLLGLGFSTFSWPVLMLVALWLLGAGARERWRPREDVAWWRFDAAQLVFAAVTVAALVAIVVSVPAGLLGSPDMHVAGNGSYGNSLRWFADRSATALPHASVFSLPLWMYKALILAWALWLSFALLRWLPWVWRCFGRDGLWRGRTVATD